MDSISPLTINNNQQRLILKWITETERTIGSSKNIFKNTLTGCLAQDKESTPDSYLSPDNVSIIGISDEDVILQTPSEGRIGLCLIARNGWVLKSEHNAGGKTYVSTQKK